MTGNERIQTVLRGGFADRIPVMLHNFPMAVREARMSQREYRSSPAKIAAVFIQAVETYDYDGVVVDLDTATLAGALGVPVDFPEDDPARCERPLLTELAQARELPPVDVADDPRVQICVEAVRILKDYFGDAVCVRGNCDQAPFSLASMVRGTEEWMMDLLDPDQEQDVITLLDYCERSTARFLELMAGAGADLLSNGDSPAGPDLISPELYRKYAQPWEQRIAARAHQLGKPYLLHICGNTTPILGDMLAAGADILELDYKTDVKTASSACRGRAVFCGNIDPSGVLARGTPELVTRRTRELLDVFAGNPRFILNAGCAIPATTPPENLHAMLRAARSY